MTGRDKTKAELLEELKTLKARLAVLEESDTAQKRIVATLLEARGRLEAVLQAVADSIIVLDGSGRLVYCNQAAAHSFGFESPQAMLPHSFADILARYEIRDAAGRIIPIEETPSFRALAGKSNPLQEVHYVDLKTGEERWEIVQAAPIEENGSEIRFSVTIQHDITEQKRSEQAQQRLIDELNAFGHTVAHDLKSPLGIVAGYLMLWSDDSDVLGPEMAEQIQAVLEYTSKMNNIIDDLFLLSSVRSADVQVELLDMDQVISEACLRLQNLIKTSDALIDKPETWPEAMGYPAWVEAVWTNYLSNAIRYGGAPPLVRLGAEPCQNGMVRFWVKDNGAGISRADQARLFREFSRMGQAKLAGHGLGLSIVRRIVERLGGSVGVESAIGEGSTFYFTLPTPVDPEHRSG
jgi:PAS domain S-box-containing protein